MTTRVLIQRRDLLPPSVHIPKELEEACVRAGGWNPFGEPLYRVVLAQDRVTQAAGEWNAWPDDVDIDDRTGLGIGEIQTMLRDHQNVIQQMVRGGVPFEEIQKMDQKMQALIDEEFQARADRRPPRVNVGMESVHLYPFEGFILEKWKPASSFGSPGDWESYKFHGVNALGEFPHNGEYELVAGPTPYLLTVKQVEDAIHEDFKNVQNRPSASKERLRLLLDSMDQRHKAQERARKTKIRGILDDSPAKLHNRVSLGADRVINEMLKGKNPN